MNQVLPRQRRLAPPARQRATFDASWDFTPMARRAGGERHAPNCRPLLLGARARSPLVVVGLPGLGHGVGDRLVGLVLVGVVDLLALDRDRAVVLAAELRGSELLLRALVVAVVALTAAEGHVLRFVGRPVLELLRGVFLELLHGLASLLALLHRLLRALALQ